MKGGKMGFGGKSDWIFGIAVIEEPPSRSFGTSEAPLHNCGGELLTRMV